MRQLLGALILAAVAGLLGAQTRDATVIVSDEELARERMAQGLAACGELDGPERTVCLANLSLAAGSAEPCAADPSGECARVAGRAAMSSCGIGRDEAEALRCEMQVAGLYAEPASCDQASSGELCLSIVAAERRDPSLLAERIRDPGTLQEAMGYYALSTGDTSVLERIEDNYTADMLRIAAETAAAGRSGEQLDPGFCWSGLRGNYQEVGGYTEDFDSTQLLCVAAVRQVNALNSALDNADSPAARERLEAEMRAMLQEMDEEAEDFSSQGWSGDDLRSAAGLPPVPAIETEVNDLRAGAEELQASCDYLGALRTAESLREAMGRWNAERAEAARREGREAAPLVDPWLAANHDEVARRAARQQEFRTLLGAARDVLEGFDESSETDLDTARGLAELAATRAATDPGCQEAPEVDELLAEIEASREILRQVLAERASGDEEERGFVDARGSATGDDEADAWRMGSREDVETGWEAGSRSDSVDPCRGSRPEYEGALLRIQGALRRDDLDSVIDELGSGRLNPRCPGDRERLEALRSAGVRLAEVEADAKNARMQAAVSGARAAAARRAEAWSSALTTIDQIVGEYQRAAAAPPPAGGGSVGATGGVAPSRAGGCAIGTHHPITDPGRGPRVYFAVRWDSGSYMVTSWPRQLTDSERRDCGSPRGCVEAVLLEPSGRGYRILGEHGSESSARRAAEQDCARPG